MEEHPLSPIVKIIAFLILLPFQLWALVTSPRRTVKDIIGGRSLYREWRNETRYWPLVEQPAYWAAVTSDDPDALRKLYAEHPEMF